MIKLKIDGHVEDLSDYKEGIEFMIEDFDDIEVGIQIGDRMVVISKIDLIHVVKSLEY